MKQCKDCKEYKDPKDFYKTQGECKDCTKLRVRKREVILRLDPEWIESERKRGRDKYHRLNYKNKYKPSPKKKKWSMERYSNKFPEKAKAKIASQHIKVPKGFEKHHWSYNDKDFKDIIPLTKKDHNQLHRFLEYDLEKMIYKCIQDIGMFKQGDPLDTKELHINYFIEIKLSDLWE